MPDRSAQVVAELIAGWPAERPLAVVWEAQGRSIVAEPGEAVRVWDGAGDPLAEMDAALRRPATREGGWMVCLSYDLGRVMEPAVERGLARPRAVADRAWPLIEMQRVERGWVVDRTGVVWGLGEWRAESPPHLKSESGAESPPHRKSELGAESPAQVKGSPHRETTHTFWLGAWDGVASRAGYEAAVARAVEYIRAGDVFQVNLAHRMSAPFEGSARAAFVALALRAGPWHGAYVESAGRAVLSVSPELFLDVDVGARRIMTRPMKGTLGAGRDPRELEESGKDRAELSMIIDLMRNDLGRVARLGSVRVVEERRIERHAGERGVWQATGCVGAELREGVSWGEIVRATFPPGSVTGAPKIRAMQIIDELEPVRRGPYCGSVGFIGDSGEGRLNVGIRTALVSGETVSPGVFARGVMDYSVGAGIVAESDPAAEWEETITKASVLDALHAS